MNRFAVTERQKDLVKRAEVLAKRFSDRSAEIDREAKFPFKNFDDLKDAGFLKLTVPKRCGGEEITLYEMLLVLETLGKGDASTALSLGWHLGILMDLALRREWEKLQFERLCREVVENHALINRAATEPATGSPTRGGKPTTTAEKRGETWVLNGRKTFTTMAPGLDYAIVTASVGGSDEVGGFLVPLDAKGVEIEPTWDTLGMKGTRSDDLVMSNVALPLDARVETMEADSGKRSPMGWLLHIPAAYLGVGEAAKAFAVQFAQTYQPNSLPGPIKEVPHIQQKIGEMELELLKARALLYSVAESWETNAATRDFLQPELAAAKTVATNAAVHVVDLAMRVVGGRSLSRTLPLEQWYRDVRAGIHNPPNDDITYSVLAKHAFMEGELR
ncbi:MAG TPA: acyl-CoA dehydrogenase family protein [Bacillales bacterium]|nr:acyl-CoA dehydrogenase family protein [Bacillales bacterium]